MRELERRANDAATVRTVDPEQRRCFIEGAVWVFERLSRLTEVHPMEDQAGARQYCDKLRLQDVNRFLRELGQYVKPDSTPEADK